MDAAAIRDAFISLKNDEHAPGEEVNVVDALFAIAREIRRFTDTLAAAVDASAGEEEAPKPRLRCSRCRGTGALGDGAYCLCPMGRDLEAAERRAV